MKLERVKSELSFFVSFGVFLYLLEANPYYTEDEVIQARRRCILAVLEDIRRLSGR